MRAQTTAEELIYNGRRGVYDECDELNPATLTGSGFALRPCATAVDDWSSLDQMRSRYLPELKRVLVDAYPGNRISDIIFWNPKLRGEGWEADGDPTLERTGIAALAHLDTDMLGFGGEIDALVRMVERNRIESLIDGQPEPGAPLIGRGRALADAVSSGERPCPSTVHFSSLLY